MLEPNKQIAAAALKCGISFLLSFVPGNYSRLIHSLNTNQHSWGHEKPWIIQRVGIKQPKLFVRKDQCAALELCFPAGSGFMFCFNAELLICSEHRIPAVCQRNTGAPALLWCEANNGNCWLTARLRRIPALPVRHAQSFCSDLPERTALFASLNWSEEITFDVVYEVTH